MSLNYPGVWTARRVIDRPDRRCFKMSSLVRLAGKRPEGLAPGTLPILSPIREDGGHPQARATLGGAHIRPESLRINEKSGLAESFFDAHRERDLQNGSIDMNDPKDRVNAFMPHGFEAVVALGRNRPAGGAFLRGEGHVRREGTAHGFRQSGDPGTGRTGGGFERDDRQTARCGRAIRGQDAMRRADLLADGPERALPTADQSGGAGPGDRRIVERIGGGGGGRAVRFRHRLRHRRLDPRAGKFLRAVRAQADAWRHRARSCLRPCAEFRHVRLVRARCGDLRQGGRYRVAGG